jgi:hypothetical protein
MKNLIKILLLFILSGCVSHTVQKATGINRGSEICILRNKLVNEDFFNAYENTLRNVGFRTKEITNLNECSVYTSYVANFGFHWGLYLSSAQLNIYKDGKIVGSATYNAPYADPTKHGRVETKIQKLVNEIFYKK